MDKQNLPAASQTDILVYQSTTSPAMKVLTDGETVWLTVDQMASLFGRDKSVIGKHVRNVFSEGELEREGFRQILPKTPLGGRPEAIYSLDVVISVGYRVKSIEGVRFRHRSSSCPRRSPLPTNMIGSIPVWSGRIISQRHSYRQ